MPLVEPNFNDCGQKCKCCPEDGGDPITYPCDNPCGTPQEYLRDSDCTCVNACTGIIASQSGNAGKHVRSYSVAGMDIVPFSYDAENIPDRFILSGAVEYDTNVTSGIQTLYLPVTDPEALLTVTVVANITGTFWRYTIGCNPD